MALDRATLRGPWAGLPVAWSDEDRFDEMLYRQAVAHCCAAGVPGVYTGGTTGEFYAMEFDEFKEVARATVEECHEHGVPAMIGCTSTYTRGAARRAEFAASLGADAIQVALPFWMEVPASEIARFFNEVSAACNGLPLSIYETRRAKRILTLDEHREIAEALPQYVMVKANHGTLGTTAEGCAALSALVNVFVGEDRWLELAPMGAAGCCSSLIYWNPRVILNQWSRIESRQWEAAESLDHKMRGVHEFLHEQFGERGFTDTTYDRLGALACGFPGITLRNRGPYPSADTEDVILLRQWLHKHFPEMLDQDLPAPLGQPSAAC
jgi:dihydrodipicolinate synthase/N-acetylneuraminate lyase